LDVASHRAAKCRIAAQLSQCPGSIELHEERAVPNWDITCHACPPAVVLNHRIDIPSLHHPYQWGGQRRQHHAMAHVRLPLGRLAVLLLLRRLLRARHYTHQPLMHLGHPFHHVQSGRLALAYRTYLSPFIARLPASIMASAPHLLKCQAQAPQHRRKGALGTPPSC
jgi:hypothetical protein